MAHLVTLTNPWIYVDDADPGISYRDDAAWARYTSNPDFRALDPGSTNTPIYGTILKTGTRVEAYTFTYTFKGTSYQLQYTTNMGLNESPCSIDGEAQLAYIQSDGLVTCKNSTLSPTEHNLTVSMEPNSSFDGFSYLPVALPVNGADTLYFLHGSMEPGNSSQFNFYGTSAGIYADISFFNSTNQSATILSYTLDQNAPMNFTIVNPLPSVPRTYSPQLLIQTPPTSRGQHTLVVSMLETGGDLNGIEYNMIIVQNSTQSLNLDAVPSTSTASSISGLPTVSSKPLRKIDNSHGTHRSVIVGIALGISALLLIAGGVWIWRRRNIRRRVMLSEDARMIPAALTLPDRDRVPRFRIQQYITREKTEKYRTTLGIQTPQERETVTAVVNVTQEDSVVVEETERRQGPIVQPQYVVHQDGGAISEEDGREGEIELGQVINLPPLYSSLDQYQSTLSRGHG